MIIDARGLKCPLPVLKLEKAVSQAPSGSKIVVLATDPVARIDIPHFCQTRRHRCVVDQTDLAMRFEITVAHTDQN